MPLTRLTTILLTVALLLCSAAGARAGCVTTTCHPRIDKGNVVHAPVAAGDCTDCHTPTAKKHPGAGSMTMVARGGALCLSCHEDVVVGKQVHGPVRAGNCAQCHVPHAAAEKGLLSQSGNRVCLNCHVEIQNIIANAVSQHQPVSSGRCWECHTPHAADYPPLLRAYYPTQLYTPYREGHYALCFSCHDKNAMEYDRTSEATAFRNRDQNLHYLHVNRSDKGRTCRVCHGVHGADQSALLRSRMHNFGKWDIPMRWVGADNGATCYVGCHRPKGYDRVFKKQND